MTPERQLAHLYDDHAPALFAFLLNLTRNEADTHDLLQDLFVTLARHPHLLNGVRHERPFLLRLAHNAAIDLMRRRATREQRHKSFAADVLSPFAPAADPDEQVFRHSLASALAELPPEQRAVVHLKLWAGLTLEEIAATLDIPSNTAASRYRYGLDKLRARLRPLYEELK
ncbi:MAG: RNA polymerase sigma factor [Limisphaerales bacterium]